MFTRVLTLFDSEYPRNLMMRKPWVGTAWLFVITLAFMLIYRPLDLNDKKVFGFEGAMAIYSALGAIVCLGVTLLLKRTHFFSDKSTWSLSKELLTVLACLSAMCVVVYAAGFAIEQEEPDFFLSVKFTFLLGILPFMLFTIPSVSSIFSPRTAIGLPKAQEEVGAPSSAQKIHIESRLKSERLAFYPDQFLMAESEGNYVTFYIQGDGGVEKTVIRNTISDIERQLSAIDHIFKTHRAFLVNLNRVSSRSGNVLGYKLHIDGIDKAIPVARQHTKLFMERFRQLTESQHC